MNGHKEFASIIARISERAACGERRAGAKGFSRSLLAARCSLRHGREMRIEVEEKE